MGENEDLFINLVSTACFIQLADDPGMYFCDDEVLNTIFPAKSSNFSQRLGLRYGVLFAIKPLIGVYKAPYVTPFYEYYVVVELSIRSHNLG